MANTTATANPALVYGAWTPVELVVDLDANTATASYNGTEFYAGVWDVATTGAPALGGINFWADGPAGAGGTYFVDDFNLQVVPEPAVTGLLALGSLVLLRSRRRKA